MYDEQVERNEDGGADAVAIVFIVVPTAVI